MKNGLWGARGNHGTRKASWDVSAESPEKASQMFNKHGLVFDENIYAMPTTASRPRVPELTS